MVRHVGNAVLAAVLAMGCERPAPPDTGAAECAAIRDLGQRSLKRWTAADEGAPPADAPVSALAAHTEGLAKTAREIGADFVRAAPRRKDLAESAEGAKMLGDLAGAKLDAMARTMRELEGRLAPLGKLQTTANDAVEGLGRDIAADVGCEGKAAPPACAGVVKAVGDLGHAPVPATLADGARASEGRALTLEMLAAAIGALPPAPPKQGVRDEKVKRAREAAAGFRELGKALEAAAPLEDRLAKERQEAGEAASRLAAELQAAGERCPRPSGSASASAPAAKPSR